MVRGVRNGDGRAAEEDPAQALAAATKRMYAVFSRYPLKSDMDACPCCTTDEDQAADGADD